VIATTVRLWRRGRRLKKENGNAELKNELEMGKEACRWKVILGWAQIIERRLCEKVVWPIGVLQ
jgi:hypothetical protein